MAKAKVTLFRRGGKYYTSEEWEIPGRVPNEFNNGAGTSRPVIGPFDMRHSPDFRRIDGGTVLVESQEPWGYPHLLVREIVMNLDTGEGL